MVDLGIKRGNESIMKMIDPDYVETIDNKKKTLMAEIIEKNMRKYWI